jgi:hypothetical protein
MQLKELVQSMKKESDYTGGASLLRQEVMDRLLGLFPRNGKYLAEPTVVDLLEHLAKKVGAKRVEAAIISWMEINDM